MWVGADGEQPDNGNKVAGTHMAIAPARLVEWPLRCGPVPPLADCHSPRPETGLGRIGKLDPGDTLILVPAPSAGLSGTNPDSRGGVYLTASGGPVYPGGSGGPGHLATSGDRALLDSSGNRALLALSGGTGKTQLAAALAHQLWDSRAVDLLVWVKASTRNAILTGYALTLADLGAADPGDDLLTGAQRFLAWLSRTERRWLVVLDDLADPADLDGLWPSGPDGRVVVTARRAHATAALICTGASCRDYRGWYHDRERRMRSAGVRPDGGPASGGPASTGSA